MKTHLIFPAGVRGCPGRTIALVAIADYLHANGQKFITFDGDEEVSGLENSFSHWFGGATRPLALRDDAAFADGLFHACETAEVDYVLADLPPNIFKGFERWQEGLCGSSGLLKVLEQMSVKATVVVPVAARSGIAQSAQRWIELARGWATCVLALNCPYFTDNDEEEVVLRLASTIEGGALPYFQIPNLAPHAMKGLLSVGKLPSEALKSPDLKTAIRLRLQGWTRRIHGSLDKTGLFLPSPVQESR